MSTWTTVLVASAVVYAIKLAGHLVPARWLERPEVARAAALITAGLLAALVVVQSVVRDGRLVADARVPAIALAAVLLWRRAPFIVVVASAAVLAAAVRAFA